MDISTEIEFEIDADDIVSDAEDKVKKYAEEVLNDKDVLHDAIENFDMTEKISCEVDSAIENLLSDKMEEYVLENPAVILKAMLKALTWAESQRQLVNDQSSEMLSLRNNLNTERNLKDFAEKALKETGHPNFQGDN